MYDKYDGVPEAGSWLESVFFIVWTRRQDQVLAKSWLDVVATLPAEADKTRLDLVNEAREKYVHTMYPYLDEAKTKKEEKSEIHDALEKFSKIKAKLDLRPVIRATIEQRKSVMRRTAATGLPRLRRQVKR